MKKNYIAPTVQTYRLASTGLLATSKIDIVNDGTTITNSDLNQSGGAWSSHRNGSPWDNNDNSLWSE